MTDFPKYMHIERFGTDEVEGIELGTCYIFPKIDGTQGVVWYQGGALHCGSRQRELIGELDNQGFKAHIEQKNNIIEMARNYPNDLVFYGEYLLKHSLGTYRNDAWGKFYIFDIFSLTEQKYLVYEKLKEICDLFEVNYIPCQAIIENPSLEQLQREIEKNVFLIEEGKGIGEGIVIKNYKFQNKFGRTTWAKIVTNEFKEKHWRAMGPPEIKGEKQIEQEIVKKYCTDEFIQKTFSRVSQDGWNSKKIPMLLGIIWHDFVNEEIWQILKDYKNPVIDFKKMNIYLIHKIKDVLSNVF